MQIPTQRLFTINTQMALQNRVLSYLGDDDDEYNKVRDAKKKYDLEKVYKFDIGRNCDGFSPLVGEVMEQTDMQKEATQNLVDYPDNHYRLLKSYFSKLYDIPSDWFIIGSGLENFIDILARIFLSRNDKYLLPVPNFSLFEEFSSRTGAMPVYVNFKKEDSYRWTAATTDEVLHSIKDFNPRLVWISNPINPTGAFIDLEIIKKILVTANTHNCFVIVDEAYGEYTDEDNNIRSCYKFVDDFENLIVLRTLSKVYGLPSIRVGYMVSKNKELDRAVALYRQYFPFSWFSLFVGQIAVVDQEYVSATRKLNLRRKNALFKELDKLEKFEYLQTASCVFLLKSKTLSADELEHTLMTKGIFVANHNNITGIEGENYIRLTIQNEDDNNYLISTLQNI